MSVLLVLLGLFRVDFLLDPVDLTLHVLHPLLNILKCLIKPIKVGHEFLEHDPRLPLKFNALSRLLLLIVPDLLGEGIFPTHWTYWTSRVIMAQLPVHPVFFLETRVVFGCNRH